VGTANSIAITLADVERALEKLVDGTYGSCDSCGEPVGEERLEAIRGRPVHRLRADALGRVTRMRSFG
jgi:RNA polymerase-binding transcription factor DksA